MATAPGCTAGPSTPTIPPLARMRGSALLIKPGGIDHAVAGSIETRGGLGPVRRLLSRRLRAR